MILMKHSVALDSRYSYSFYDEGLQDMNLDMAYFLCQDALLTWPPMVEPIILGYMGEPDVFNQLCGNLGACPCGGGF